MTIKIITKYIVFLAIISLIVIVPLILQGCSTTPISNLAETIVIRSVSVSPEAVAPNAYVLLTINAFDTDGNTLFYRYGTGECLALNQNKNIIIQAPGQVGTAEIDFAITNGRKDIFQKVQIRVDDSLPSSTIRHGTTTLPMDKSFDFFKGEIVDQYYGDIDYYNRYYYGNSLSFKGDRNGSTSSDFDGGLINLTYFNPDIKDLNQVIEAYSGEYFQDGVPAERQRYDESTIKVGDVFCFRLKYSSDFFGKLKIISIDDGKIVFDWVFQKTPGEKRFYDYAPSVSAITPPAAPSGLIATVKSTGEVVLSWEAVNEADIIGYDVYRSTVSGSGFSKVGSVGRVTTFTDSGLRASATYYYKTKAIDSDFDESDYSSETFITTSSGPILILNENVEDTIASWEMSGFSVSTYRHHSGFKCFYSGTGNNLNNLLKLNMPIVISGSEILKFWMFYNSEDGYDYLRVEVSEDNANWSSIESYSGVYGDWIQKSIALYPYANKTIYLRFKYETDSYTYYEGFYLDDITIER